MVPSPRTTDRLRLRLPANVDGLESGCAPGPGGVASVILAVLLFAGTLAVARTPVSSAKAAPDPPPRARHSTAARPRPQRALFPNVLAPAAIVVDAGTGQVFFAKGPDQPLPIASLSKIMTALLVLERGHLSATAVVSRRAASAEPVVVGLRPRERISGQALLYGMLLRSGNDAATALAEHVSGSVSAFVALMNRRAHSLGLRHTWFADPAGLDDRGYGTARDLANLTRVALADRSFAAIVNTDRFVLRDGHHRARALWNINLFRGQYPGAIGVKTGFTSRAGDCLVAAARRDGRTMIAVVLGDSPATHWQDAFGDAARLLDYAFAWSPSGQLSNRSGRSI
jgi:D-alanyl-D-alanine carboxypeptidase (penicillin-binding protein 5/6)